MGGRGAAGKRHMEGEGFAFEREQHGEPPVPIFVAGMNRDIANGVTPEKTLDYLEKVYKKGMGREQAQILDDRGFVVKAYQGGRNSVSLDLDLTKGRIYTHNHPGRWGGTFSKADIRSMSHGGKEIRASAAEGVYSLKATRKAAPRAMAEALVNSRNDIVYRMAKVSQRVSRMGIANPQRRATVMRRLQLAVLHRWYQRNAGQFGFKYQFVRNKDYKI